jgi:putative intracellular protease/amidase
MPKVLIINTSAATFEGGNTGVWLEETATPYYAFLAAGFEVAMANPTGGPSPIDQGSMGENFFTDDCKKFMHDAAAVGMFMHQQKLADVDVSGYDAIYLAGGHGTCTDFVDNPALKAAIEKTYGAGKVVAADCHGPIALPQCTKPDGTPLVKGLTVTGFSNSEEDAVGLTEKVPYLLETKLKEMGANYESGADWNSKVCVDGNLISGQNPQSSKECADAVVAKLKGA